jgi:hypothetical protein
MLRDETMKKHPKSVNSSQIMGEVFGDTNLFSQILKKEADRILKKYKDRDLAGCFSEMPYRSIALIPMIMYDAMMRDLGRKPDKKILVAVGLLCFPIGTHDDVVDEMPRTRRRTAALIYSGNIAALEGMRILSWKGIPEVVDVLIESINQNHYRQQRVVSILWEGKKISVKRYFDGISHIVDFVSIGLLAALAEAERMDLKERIMNFSKGYGYAIQLIDDIREVDEDQKMGYSSLPMTEKRKFALSLKLAHEYLDFARRSIPREWKNLNAIIDRTDHFLKIMEDDLHVRERNE